MEDLRAQLEALRARIRQIESQPKLAPVEPLPGIEVETPKGRHLEMRTIVATHGDFHFSRLDEISPDALHALTDGLVANVAPDRIAFLDTETTGLAGGSGTVAFLTGIGRLTREGFLVRQYFMRDFSEEASMLHAVTADLEDAELLVTYNGRAYDEPLLASRYTMARMKPPFGRLPHVDLLYGSRRLWKLRFDSCRLVELEAQILGHLREGDVPGGLIPQIYFEFLRTGRPGHLHAVLHHNALDIRSLAALTAILPVRFSNVGSAVHAAELVGLGRWLISKGDREEAASLYERAIATIEFDRLPQARRRDVYVHLAKHFEHRAKDTRRALDMAMEVLLLDEAAPHHRRVARLRHKISQGTLTP